MDYSRVNIYTLMQANMGYLSERQAVLAKNVANADTPDFNAMDIKKPDFKRFLAGAGTAGGTPIARTHASHMKLNRGSMTHRAFSDDNNFELTPVENGVSLDEQILKLNETAFAYQTTTSLYKKMGEMMKVALGSGGGQ